MRRDKWVEGYTHAHGRREIATTTANSCPTAAEAAYTEAAAAVLREMVRCKGTRG